MSTVGVAHHKMLIDGGWVDSGQRHEIRNPATEEIVATVAKGTVEDADRASSPPSARSERASGRARRRTSARGSWPRSPIVSPPTSSS